MKYYYHATVIENLTKILIEGLKAGVDGGVYLTEKPEEACRFMAVRGIRNAVVLKVKVYKADESKITEAFDHSYKFFKCRSYIHKGDIELSRLAEVLEATF